MPFLIRIQNFWTRLTHWEYWPMGVVYFPVFMYWLWLSVKARSFFFFSAANPGIPTGGMLGESKSDILEKIPQRYKPRTWTVKLPVTLSQLQIQLTAMNFTYPLIAKPDVGERGWGVAKLTEESELEAYLQGAKNDFIIQEYIDYPWELGLFYYRLPDQAKGVVTSIVVKEFLTITGDGKYTLEDLVRHHPRARLQYRVLRKKYVSHWREVIPEGTTMLLEPIGNHCRGTKFLNGNELITRNLQDVFDGISGAIEGFYYGRFDLRCRSIDELYRGEGIRILELNGVGAEPGHIYHPGFPFFRGTGVLLRHWSVLYQISRQNHRNGVPYLTLREAWHIWKNIRKGRNMQAA